MSIQNHTRVKGTAAKLPEYMFDDASVDSSLFMTEHQGAQVGGGALSDESTPMEDTIKILDKLSGNTKTLRVSQSGGKRRRSKKAKLSSDSSLDLPDLNSTPGSYVPTSNRVHRDDDMDGGKRRSRKSKKGSKKGSKKATKKSSKRKSRKSRKSQSGGKRRRSSKKGSKKGSKKASKT